MTRYLIWDFDGTLAQRSGLWSHALLEALEPELPGHGFTSDAVGKFLHTGFPWHHPEIIRAPAQTADEWWDALYPVFVRAYCEGLQLESAQAQRLCRQARQAYLHPRHWSLFDDTLPCLDALARAGWKHVILSNHVPELGQIIDFLGISSRFEAVIDSAETGVEKPHRYAFQNALRTMGHPESVLMIGDSMAADVMGAKAAGIDAILVRKPHPDATRYFASLHELTSFLILP